MTSGEFFEFLKRYRESKTYPNSASWPASITLNSDAWNGISKLYKYTTKHDREYETSFFFADGDVVNTPPFKGEKSSVVSSHSMDVKFVPKDKDGKYYEKQILLDGSISKRISVKREKLPKKIQAGFLFNVHSHPIHYLDSRTGMPYNPALDPESSSFRKPGLANFLKVLTGRYKDPRKENPNLTRTYGFFSDTDIRSLLASTGIVSGLVTDEFWLVGKTDKVVSQIGENGIQMLQNISNKAYAGDKYLEDVLKSEMAGWGLVFYRARFNQTLRRLN